MKKYLQIFVLATIVLFPGFLMAQTVTVHSNGTSGDYQTITAALSAVQGNSAGPDVITILDAGPFLENSIVISGDNGSFGGSALTIQASSGVRPVVAVADDANSANGEDALFVARDGLVTIKDLIIIPQESPATPSEAGVGFVGAYEASGGSTTSTGFNFTFENLLICPNNGSNQPAASLDGTSVTGASATFNDEGVFGPSTSETGVNNVLLKNVIVCGLSGINGSAGIRFHTDGAAGSTITIGEGCVSSFNNEFGLYTGANNGMSIKILGTNTNPVKIFGNTSRGVNVTAAPGLVEIIWCLIANNGSMNYLGNQTEVTAISNCTIANNTAECLRMHTGYSVTHNITGNCVLAGNGSQGSTTNNNYIKCDSTGGGALTITDSAVVLEGDYSLDITKFDGDGLYDNNPSNATLTNIINEDPMFINTDDPSSEDFFRVGNPSYFSAGPGGGALSGYLLALPTPTPPPTSTPSSGFASDMWEIYK
jgi:hypothetical protein